MVSFEDNKRNPVLSPEEHSLDHNTRLKEAITQLIPKDQALYPSGHVAYIPEKYYERGFESDAIPLKTRFDIQAAMGQFSTEDPQPAHGDPNQQHQFDQLTEQYTDGLREFCAEVDEVIKIRDKYIKLSCQRPLDNPLNWDDWISYPPPQPKGWHYEDVYGAMDYYYDERAVPHYVGETFDIEDYRTNIVEPYMRKLNPDKNRKVIHGASRALEVEGFECPGEIPNFHQFVEDLSKVIKISTNKVGSILSTRRLDYLRAKFESYSLLNENKETYITKLNPHRDFYNVRKVDNNVDLAMSMTKKLLLNVINFKLKQEPDRVVYDEDGVKMTLAELFAPYVTDGDEKRLNIDDLFEFGLIDRTFTQQEQSLFGNSTRYDSIIKDEILLKIDKTFLRVENSINGEYLSCILKQVLSDYEKSKYQYAELGINFNLLDCCGRGTTNKWSSIAKWIVDNKLVSHNVKWIIRLPRNYTSLRKAGKVRSFQDYLDLVFRPLFDVSINPEIDVNLHFFLTKVASISLLSGHHQHDERTLFDIQKLRPPKRWTTSENPPYSYYLYYIFINLTSLNHFRKGRRLPTLTLRSFAASQSDQVGLGLITESLATSFLLSKDIINGEQLRNHPVLQYLYFLKQIGITMSPLCWNKTTQLKNDDDRHPKMNSNVAYESNPAIDFFKVGMRVALSTNKPLFASFTRESLIEEYSVAASIYKLGNVDLCELCRNSVLISGFNSHLKRHWIGIQYVEDEEHDTINCDEFSIQRCNVPDMRLNYRADCVKVELEFIRSHGAGVVLSPYQT